MAIERYTPSRDSPLPASTELLVTHAYRPEDGQWLEVHRNADENHPTSRRQSDPHRQFQQMLNS